MNRLTRWFPRDVPPVHSGWYDTKLAIQIQWPIGRRWWDSATCKWYIDFDVVPKHLCIVQDRMWRGRKQP